MLEKSHFVEFYGAINYVLGYILWYIFNIILDLFNLLISTSLFKLVTMVEHLKYFLVHY